MKKIIGIDLGGTNLRIGLVVNGKIKKIIHKKTPKTKDKLIKELFSSIHEFMGKDISGIAIASPGPLKKGVIKNSPNIPLKNFNLKKALETKFKTKVEVENDANCVALAEAKLGVKKNNFFILTLGTGIGGGVIINGELYNKNDIGAELGYIYIDKNKSLEDLAGFKIISKITKKEFGKEIYIGKLIKMNNRKSKKIIDDLTENLGRGIGSLINIFNPEVVVLTGGMSESGSKFLNLIRKKSKKYILLPKKYNIQYSKLKHPGILGAALLLDKTKTMVNSEKW